jgi:hypothetical protein
MPVIMVKQRSLYPIPVWASLFIVTGQPRRICNHPKVNNAPGMIFLDYIRLEPQVDPND